MVYCKLIMYLHHIQFSHESTLVCGIGMVRYDNKLAWLLNKLKK